MPHCRQIHRCLLEISACLAAPGGWLKGPKGLWRDHLDDICRNQEKNNSQVNNIGSWCRTTWEDVGNSVSDGWGWGLTACAREGNGKKEARLKFTLATRSYCLDYGVIHPVFKWKCEFLHWSQGTCSLQHCIFLWLSLAWWLKQFFSGEVYNNDYTQCQRYPG